MDKGYLKRLEIGTQAYRDRLIRKAHRRLRRIKARIANQSLVGGGQYRTSKSGLLRPIKPKPNRL